MRCRELAPVLLLPMFLLSAAPAAAQMGMPGGGGFGGGSGGGGGFGGGQGGRHGQSGEEGEHRPTPPRPPKPLKRDRFDKVVAAMFRTADINHDGTVTLDELRTVIDARRDAAIRARFTRIDVNKDGRIDFAEFAAWERAMGSVAASDAQSSGTGAQVAENIAPDVGNGDGSRLLRRLVEPLSSTVLTAANTNYDAGVTLDELTAYMGKAFDAADTNHDGEISADEARAVETRDGRRGGDRRGLIEQDPDQERLHPRPPG